MADLGKILVTGAPGHVGSALLERLTATEVEVRALVHDESKVQSLRDRGVEIVLGDFLEPETMGPVLEGVSTVFLLTPIHPEQVPQASNVIQAAKESGNDPRIVRLSVQQASHEAPARNSRQHAQIEDQHLGRYLAYVPDIDHAKLAVLEWLVDPAFGGDRSGCRQSVLHEGLGSEDGVGQPERSPPKAGSTSHSRTASLA
jgi:hypothetical protein